MITNTCTDESYELSGQLLEMDPYTSSEFIRVTKDDDQRNDHLMTPTELSGQLLEHKMDPYTSLEFITDTDDYDQMNDRVITPTKRAHLNSSMEGVHVDNTGSDKLYTIVLHLAGQQASGIQALINIQCQVHTLGLPVVFLEPVIVLNKFKAMPIVNFDNSGNPSLVVRFSDLFDLGIFNNFSSKMKYAPIAPREDFFANAPRKVILVNFYEGMSRISPRLSLLWPEKDTPTGGCFDPLKSGFASDPKYQLHQLVSKGFCIVKVVQYQVIGHGQGRVFTQSELKESILGDIPYSEFSLVFSLWMPKYVLPSINDLHCANSGYRSAKGQFQPSKYLLESAEYYKKHFLNSTENHLTLMIRLEHIYTFLRRSRQNWTVRKCLDAAIAKVKEFQSERNFGRPFVTLDVGRYGSKSIRRFVGKDNVRSDTQYISELLASVYDGRWSMKEWESSFIEATGGIDESSYIAALQRTLASKAECLVLVGGGMFQELTMRKYMESHDKEDRCIYMLCLKNDINSEIAKS